MTRLHDAAALGPTPDLRGIALVLEEATTPGKPESMLARATRQSPSTNQSAFSTALEKQLLYSRVPSNIVRQSDPAQAVNPCAQS